jgi:hypothetical protein
MSLKDCEGLTWLWPTIQILNLWDRFIAPCDTTKVGTCDMCCAQALSAQLAIFALMLQHVTASLWDETWKDCDCFDLSQRPPIYLCIGMPCCRQPRLLEQVCGSSDALGKQIQDVGQTCGGRDGVAACAYFIENIRPWEMKRNTEYAYNCLLSSFAHRRCSKGFVY